MADAGALNASLAEMLDMSGLGVIQLDAHGRIVAVNDRTRSVLKHNDGLSDRGGVLSAASAKDNDRLQTLRAAALPRPGHQQLDAGGSRRRFPAPDPPRHPCGSLEETFERVALGLMLLGICFLELLEVHQLPANGRQVSGFGQADQAEVRLGIVKGEQVSIGFQY